MRLLLIPVFLWLATSCSIQHSGAAEGKNAPAGTQNLPVDPVAVPEDNTDESDSDMATYFIVIADTGQNYVALRDKMFGLQKQLNLPIDTLGRVYDKAKRQIVVPETDEDELYHGEYFPRRFPSGNLSLEHFNFYQPKAGAQTLALVTGIYEQETSADSALAVVKKSQLKAFKVKSEIYTGCMH